MSGSDIEDENILGHFQEVLHRSDGSLDTSSVFSAEYACLRSMMLEPQNTTLWNALALVYMLSDCVSDAEEAIERSLDIDTSNAWTWSIWGDLLRQEERLVEAERSYRMAMELNSNDTHSMRQLAGLYFARGAYPEALDIFQMLISVYPNDQELWDVYSGCLRMFND
ncbi:MAG: tetratricopeptide repeat protein [Candidatus Sifarchaeia archaeon]